MAVRIGVNDIPAAAELEAIKYKLLRNNMGDFYLVHCRDLTNNNVLYNIFVTEGYLFEYLESLRELSNPRRFIIKRRLDGDSGQYVLSINNDDAWVMLREI